MDARGVALPTNPPAIDPDQLYREWLRQNFVWTPGAAMFRRARLLEIGGFPEDVSASADYAVYLRLARGGEVVFDSRDVVRYRQHGASMSRDPALMLDHTLEVLRRERPHVPRALRRAFRDGRREWAEFYGEQAIQRLRHERRAGRGVDPRLAVALLRVAAIAPGMVATHVRRKMWRLLRGLPPTAVEASRFSPDSSSISTGTGHPR